MKRYIFLALALIISQTLKANEAPDHAFLARNMWSAFECSSLMVEIDNPEEERRLFNVGYSSGSNFLKAWDEGRISKEEMKQMPIGVLWLLRGPTPEFILGRMFQSIQEETLRDLHRDATDEIARKSAAKARYQTNNCVLIRGER